MQAVQEGVEAAGWQLSGLQKTTSHQFQGRWQGETSRSAYLFFHLAARWEAVAIDVYLDETSRGLQGNLALVLEGRPLRELGDPAQALEVLGRAAAESLPPGYRTPVALRLRLPDSASPADAAEVEIRFKLRLPAAVIREGAAAVSFLSRTTVAAFEALAGHESIRPLVVLE
jgi:hypothetical protein